MILFSTYYFPSLPLGDKEYLALFDQLEIQLFDQVPKPSLFFDIVHR